jgi:hypothetical protein
MSTLSATEDVIISFLQFLVKLIKRVQEEAAAQLLFNGLTHTFE